MLSGGGAKTGALSSGFRNIEEALWPERSRDPKGMCGSPDPFELTQGFGNGRGYQSPSAHGEGGFSLGGLVKDMVAGGIVGGLGSAGFYGAGKAVDALRSSVVGRRKVVPRPNHGQGFSKKGYNPKPGERTFEGYVRNNADPEVSLYTRAKGFNNGRGKSGGQFKRLGAQEHYRLSPHVHQPVRNVAPDGTIYGGTGKTVGVDTLFPNEKDIKQLYEYLNNGKYRR